MVFPVLLHRDIMVHVVRIAPCINITHYRYVMTLVPPGAARGCPQRATPAHNYNYSTAVNRAGGHS